jgi:3-(3-hydroxy-phenyl)propionate hydroxylase
VRAIVEQAIFMGRVVCAIDPEVARARDAQMIADRAKAAGAPRSPGPPSTLAAGCILADAPAAGRLFPQPWAGDLRLDDRLGDGAVLISRSPAKAAGPRTLSLDDPALAPFRGALERWLDEQGVEAVLVRPDRYVFGAGDPAALSDAWRSWMTETVAA